MEDGIKIHAHQEFVSMKQPLGFDFMATGDSHCLYHLGFIKYFSPSSLFVHRSSEVSAASKAYGQGISCNVIFKKQLSLIYIFLISLRHCAPIHIVGISLKLTLVLLPLIFIISRNRVTIHMHGQLCAIRNQNSIKFFLWKQISRYCDLVVANPAYCGPSFVKKIKNLNHILINSRRMSSNDIKIKIGSKHKSQNINFSETFRKKIIESTETNYFEYVEILKKCSHVLIEFDDLYYLYSPSGRLSDALNFSQTVVVSAKQKYAETAKYICESYGVDYIDLSELKFDV